MLMIRATKPTAALATLRRADWGEYLSEYEWDHAVHLTTRKPMSERRLVREFLNGFIRRLARSAQRCIPYFYAVELQVGGFPHIHALVAGTASLSPREVAARWSQGFTRIVRYTPARGAAFYVSKRVLDVCEEYDVSTRKPPRRLRAV
jgi:hypothetical protein